MLDKMRLELAGSGQKVQFVAINSVDALKDQQKLIDRCDFPLFQDTEAVGAWKLQGGKKDDFYIYDASGALVHYLPIGGDTETDLSKPAGYDNLKRLLMSIQ